MCSAVYMHVIEGHLHLHLIINNVFDTFQLVVAGKSEKKLMLDLDSSDEGPPGDFMVSPTTTTAPDFPPVSLDTEELAPKQGNHSYGIHNISCPQTSENPE